MMENTNLENQNIENMEPVNENETLEDDFYYENDDFNLDGIEEIDPIEIPTSNSSATEETPQIFESTTEDNNSEPLTNEEESQEEIKIEEPTLPNFDVNESEIDKIVEEVDNSENNEVVDREYDGASFDDMFDSLYSDVEGANHFISNLIDQKKNVNENETELAEINTLMECVDSSTLFYQSLSRIQKNIKGNADLLRSGSSGLTPLQFREKTLSFPLGRRVV